MTTWSKTGAGSEAYHYHPSGWRIYKRPASGSGTLYMYGPSGQLLHEEPDTSSTYPKTEYVYFAGRLLYVTAKPSVSDNWVYTAMYSDRLGTVRARGAGTALTRTSHYPFGEEIGTPSANNTYKFASTYRDAVWDGSQYVATGLDYAVNRYYASGMGRFLAVDQGPHRTGRPQSWNKYSYGLNDPVNLFDPAGLDAGAPCGTDAAGLALCDIDTAGEAEMGRIFYDSMIAATSEGEGSADWDPTPTGISAGSNPSPAKPKCDPQYQSWIDAHGADSASVAGSMGTTEANILGLSALESGFGSGRFAGSGISNFFNLETRTSRGKPIPDPLPLSTGWTRALGNPRVLVATYTSYPNSAKSFAAVDGKYLNGVTDPTQFATIAHNDAKFGVGNSQFIGSLVGVINKLADCLKK